MSIFLVQSLWAKNIVLLSSLPAKDLNTIYKVENIFKNKLSNLEDHKLIYINEADQEQLYFHLNNPETMALFWISHGGFKKIRGNRSGAIKPAPILFDHKKFNVAKTFQKIHPNIQFISVVGCNSFQILKDTIQKREDLGYYIPTKKVIATWALKKSIRRFKKHYWNNKYNYISEDQTLDGIRIKITRTTKRASESLKVLAGRKLIGIIPKTIAKQTQVFEYYIPFNEVLNKQSLKIVLSSGQNAEDETNNFGEIEITSSDLNMWKLFAKRDGTPFGINERVFLFKDKLENINDVQNYILYQAH